MTFALIHIHKYSVSDLENMVPWEREVYINLLQQHIAEENEKIKLQNQQIKASRR
jgi:hypothetical protein